MPYLGYHVSILSLVSETQLIKKPRCILKKSIRAIARSGIIAAIYFVITFILSLVNLAYGPLQFRLSEVLTLLPVLLPEGVPGIMFGCMFSNLLSPYGAVDIVIGTFASSIAAILTRHLRKNIYLAAMPPIIINALLVPVIFLFLDQETVYWIAFLEIFTSQSIVILFAGIPFILVLKDALIKSNLIKREYFIVNFVKIPRKLRK